MELDGFCPSLGLAFEHQGEQHYSMVTHYIRTRDQMRKRRTDDTTKARLCRKHHIILVRLPAVPDRLPVGEIRNYIKRECLHNGIRLPANFDSKRVDLRSAYSTPTSREMLATLKAIAIERGGRCLSRHYEGCDGKILWECSKGHLWKATASNVKNNGSWCPRCAPQATANKLRSNIDNMQEIARARGGKCLSTVYVNSGTHLWWQCAERHKWKAVPGNVVSGQWCPVCARRIAGAGRRLSLKDMQVTAKKKGGRCLSMQYVNSATPLLWECKFGHRWKAAPSYVRYETWCPVCAKRRGSDK